MHSKHDIFFHRSATMSGRTIECQSLYEPSHVSTHLTLAACLVGLGVSVGFLRKTWREWLISSGIRPANQSEISHASKAHYTVAKTSSTRDSDLTPIPAIIVKTAETSATTAASHTSLQAIPTLTAASRRRSLHLRPLPTLLLVTWTLYALDHVLMLLVTIYLQWICPEFNCFSRILPVSGTCAAAPLFTVVVFLQPLGASAFVLSTVVRLILSRPRWIALRVACALVGIVNIVRELALALRLVLFTSNGEVSQALDVPVVYAVTEATYVMFYAVVGLVCLTHQAQQALPVQLLQSVHTPKMSSMREDHDRLHP
ncbi:hypothetical protein BCR44DRAFT_399986 [Catenaria anguillulae PL171]|uniref:Uncharacterized protein n=1 Tax=Catenaria anguillulae PL171 TaxID=765915 RepID=A0A1Y2HF14_9FUNG|nr:hypothetical protein BCR44DRAFT_399986 [Catenaria anguillulae PL171]